jgi:hypothetical protein
MAVLCNRLDENKGTFGPFVAGQKDDEIVDYMQIINKNNGVSGFRKPEQFP